MEGRRGLSKESRFLEVVKLAKYFAKEIAKQNVNMTGLDQFSKVNRFMFSLS